MVEQNRSPWFSEAYYQQITALGLNNAPPSVLTYPTDRDYFWMQLENGSTLIIVDEGPVQQASDRFLTSDDEPFFGNMLGERLTGIGVREVSRRHGLIYAVIEITTTQYSPLILEAYCAQNSVTSSGEHGLFDLRMIINDEIIGLAEWRGSQ